MDIKNGLVDSIGNTPLLRLKRASEETGCDILGKAEFLNPGQSVKDRAALYIIKDAVARGELKPGGVIVEGTAGNTGIGLALVGNALGFRSVIVIPETQSEEKKDMLRLCGAELIEVPAVPYKDPNNYVKYSGRLAEELAAKEPNGAIWANQFDNVANRQAHVEDHGAGNLAATQGGKVDGFICAVGSGGTLAGVAEWPAAAKSSAMSRSALPTPMAPRFTASIRHGEMKSAGDSITEGIGQGRITADLEGCADRPGLPDPRRGSAADRVRPAEGRRPLPRRIERYQRRRARSVSRRRWVPDTLSSPCSAITERAIQSKLFNPSFLKEEKPALPGLALKTGFALLNEE